MTSEQASPTANGFDHAVDALVNAVNQKCSRIVVGLDSDYERFPDFLKSSSPATRQFEFNRAILDSLADVVAAVKLQVAFYECLGPSGLEAYARSVEYARSLGLFVIGDVKRGDIGSTAEAYAQAHFGGFGQADALTVNPYFGADGIRPFLRYCESNGKAIFVLIRTSNPSAKDLQDLACGSVPLFQQVGKRVQEWGRPYVGTSGYSLVGGVVGATYSEEARQLRDALPHTFFLVPGFGAQGAAARDVACCFDADGNGAVVNSSRSIIFAYETERRAVSSVGQIARCAHRAASRMRDEINDAVCGR